MAPPPLFDGLHIFCAVRGANESTAIAAPLYPRQRLKSAFSKAFWSRHYGSSLLA